MHYPLRILFRHHTGSGRHRSMHRENRYPVPGVPQVLFFRIPASRLRGFLGSDNQPLRVTKILPDIGFWYSHHVHTWTSLSTDHHDTMIRIHKWNYHSPAWTFLFCGFFSGNGSRPFRCAISCRLPGYYTLPAPE